MRDNFHDWDKLEWSTIIPGYRAKFVHSDNMTFALWDVDAGAPLPEHSHPHEQVTHLLDGNFEMTIDAKTKVMQPGEVAIIPSNVSPALRFAGRLPSRETSTFTIRLSIRGVVMRIKMRWLAARSLNECFDLGVPFCLDFI